MPKVEIEVYANTGKAKKELKETEESLGALGKVGENISKKLDNLWKDFATGQLVVDGIKKAISGAKGLIESFINVGIETENYQVRLEALLGSQKAASEAMEFFKDLAAKVPFTLREVIESGTTLVSFGLDMKQWTPVLTDLAAVMGMSLPEAASALGRAFAGGVGAADIFRERGILQIIKDSAKMKYGIEDLTKVSLPEFRKIMYETFTDPEGKIYGASDKLSKTWTGLVSMLQDKWFQFRDAVMKAGVFEKLKEKLEEFNKKLDEWIASGGLEEWANKTAGAIMKVIDAMERLIELIPELPKGLPGVTDYFARELTGVNDEWKKVEQQAKRAAIEWRNSLEILKPSWEEMLEVGKKGRKAWEEYKQRIEELDKQLAQNKETITGWIEKGAEWLGLKGELKKKTEETKGGIKDETTWLELEKKKVQEKVLAIRQLIPAHRELFDIVAQAPSAFQDEIYGFEMTLEAGRNLSDILKYMPSAIAGEWEGNMPRIPKIVEENTTKAKHYFDGLYNDIARSMANTFEDMITAIAKGLDFAHGDFFDKAINFKKMFESLFEDIKKAFFRMIAEMTAGWIIDKFKSLFESMGKSLVSSMSNAVNEVGKTVSSIAQGVAGAVSGIWTALGSAVGSFLGNLLSGGGWGTTEKHWVQQQLDIMKNIQGGWLPAFITKWDEIKEILGNGINVAFGYANALAEDRNNYLLEISGVVSEIREAAFGVWGILKGMKTAQFGFEGIVTKPTLFMAGEAGPERVIIQPSGGGGTYNNRINLVFNISGGGDIVNITKTKIIPIIQEYLDRALLKVPAMAVGK